jgi:hypothetical protein
MQIFLNNHAMFYFKRVSPDGRQDQNGYGTMDWRVEQM